MGSSFLNIRDFGAKGIAQPAETVELKNLQYKWLQYPAGIRAVIYRPRPGAEYDSKGIQLAIDAAHAQGGGTVLVPAGDYLIGPIELKSRVRLFLEPGACLWASPEMKDYDLPAGEELPDFTHVNGFNRGEENLTLNRRRLISAAFAKDVSIAGPGSIQAQSPAFIVPWMNGYPKDLLSLSRPTDTMLFHRCERVHLEGFFLRDTPAWSVVFDSCNGVRVQGIEIRGFDVINSDGIDLVNTSNATISDCRIHCTDDAICLKNMVPGATMGNITVTNCVIRTLCNAFKIGTDSAGNFQDITVNNLTINGPADSLMGDRGGINLCALDGGFVRNVNLSNIVMRNVFCPFYCYSTSRESRQREIGLTPQPGLMERISITNLYADGVRYPSFIVGHPDRRVRNVFLSNINICKTLDFYDILPEGPVPELPESYPTPFTFGSREIGDQLPAYGLYLRNVDEATIRDFQIECLEADVRDVLVHEQCSDITTTGLRVRLKEGDTEPSSKDMDSAALNGAMLANR